MIATGLMVLSVFFFVFPLFLDGTRRFRVNLVGNFCKDREIIRRYFQCSTCRKRQVVNAIKSQPKLLSKIDEVVSHFLNIVQTMHERCNSSLEAHGAWFPPWLATHANYYKELATTHWKEHGQPVLDVLLQKVSEKSIQAQQFMEPHFESSKVKWMFLVSITEPYVQTVSSKAVEVYHTSKSAMSSHIAKVQRNFRSLFPGCQEIFSTICKTICYYYQTTC
ncbi:uncharacterized protein LOC122022450 [Zingiber officinale]|uniref:uncharacterized protein LOC122022450 n=1 Tax=Zingiber officinale TaxID=94328 RepID=UPI001C4DCDFA|nr:uncharacterized protein LOC122022450 [Zingiber officinale]XP_042436399.1 uncharacterized protein LOC122022450 [Zingiber officinale]